LDLTIVLQTPNAILIDKPAEWLSIPGRDPKDTRPVLGRILEEQLQTKIFPIHRLDAEVSGLILYGLTPEFHKEANALFENKQIKKTYQAFTNDGPFEKNQKMTWRSKILRGKKRTYEAAYGKDSLTDAEVFNKTSSVLEWRLNPVTGRAHQLRFELAKRECPILGDVLYGSKDTWSEPGIALRAVRIDFPEDFASRWSLPVFYETSQLLKTPTKSN
jgi:tRNA pseudouridine32 synthase / 23S rRNA pseudouridine746 synthase